MDVLRQRFPTRPELVTLFLVSAFPLHVWAILMFLYELPSFMRRLDAWDILSIFAYTQAFALFESAVVWAAVVFTCLALPKNLFRVKFVPVGALFLLLSFLWIAPVHFQVTILDRLEWNMSAYNMVVLVWVIFYFVIVGGSIWMAFRSARFESLVNSLVERLTVLSVLYVVVDVIGILIVIGRNLF